MMEKIVKVHYPDIENKIVKEALKRFYWIREMEGLRKKPSTSELIDWIKALMLGGVNVDKITNEIPFLGTLLKTEQDTERFARMSKWSRGLREDINVYRFLLSHARKGRACICNRVDDIY